MKRANVAAANDLIAGVDIGGTFTDLTIHDPATGAVTAVKAPSDRARPERGALADDIQGTTPGGEPSRRTVRIDGAPTGVAVQSRGSLAAGTVLAGPRIIEEMTATTYVPQGWTVTVGRFGELDLNRNPTQTDRQGEP